MASRTKKTAKAREFTVVIEKDSAGWFVASVPELKGCHTQARSLDALMKRVREAIDACVEATTLGRANQFIGVQRIAV